MPIKIKDVIGEHQTKIKQRNQEFLENLMIDKALYHLHMGNYLTREKWDIKEFLFFSEDNHLMKSKDGIDKPYKLNDDDLFANDWKVVEEE